MIVRKRTRNGKSQNMTVKEKLSIEAYTKNEVTLSFTLDYYLTQFNITLTRLEAEEISQRLNIFLRKEQQ